MTSFPSGRTLLAFVLVLLGMAPRGAWAGDTWTPLYSGVRMLHRTTSAPVWDIHVLEVKLDTPGVSLQATTSAQRKRTPASFAKLVGAEAAVNGDFFSYTDYSPRSLATGQGVVWPGSADNRAFGTIAFGKDNRVDFYPMSQIVSFDSSWMWGTVGGRPDIVKTGAVIDNSGYGEHCTVRHPRTSVGLSQDKKTLYVAVVDGRQTTSVGMTCNELGALMKSVGAYTALSLDGGGSTSMYVAKLGVVNAPSDGNERVVANHLAIHADPLTSLGLLKGVIYDEAGGIGSPLEGATVKLAGVATDKTDGTGTYEFNVPPGTYTVTASKLGYVTKSITRTVVAGETWWGSMGLVKAPAATDTDGDQVPDLKDNCPAKANADQLDTDNDHLGNVCDPDNDGDAVPDDDDNCPLVTNVDQADADDDGTGDLCDAETLPVDEGEPGTTVTPSGEGEPEEGAPRRGGCASAGMGWAGAAAGLGLLRKRRKARVSSP
jgi:hypothetical protein